MRIYILITYLLINTNIIANELNIFSARQEVLMKPLLDKFERKTDIKVNIIAAKANQLINKIVQEGEFTKADILITTDVGRLHNAKEKDLFQKITSKKIEKVVPKIFRDKDNYWVGLSLRSRFFVYNKNTVKKEDLKGYLDLRDIKWSNKILIRSSNNVYNQSLISAMIINYGEKKVTKFLEGFVENFARKPSGGDRDQIRAILSGEGDLAIVNSYYYLKMKNEDKNGKLKDLIEYYPQDNFMNTHLNVSGAGIIKSSKNKGNAIKFLEFLLSKEGQKIYAEVNYEYPIRNDIKLNSFMSKNSKFVRDDLILSEVAAMNKKAIFMMDIAGWK